MSSIILILLYILHYFTVSQRPQTITKIKINANKLDEVVPVPKSRRVFPEHEGKYKITMPAGTTEKTKKILRKQMTGEQYINALL